LLGGAVCCLNQAINGISKDPGPVFDLGIPRRRASAHTHTTQSSWLLRTDNTVVGEDRTLVIGGDDAMCVVVKT